MKKRYFVIGVVIIIFIIVAAVIYFQNNEPDLVACTLEAKLCPDGSSVGRTGPNCEFAPCPESRIDKSNLIRVSVQPNSLITSPYVVSGEARGYWYFEASFPIHVFDDNSNRLGIAIAQAQTDWMTEEFVPFKAVLNFDAPETTSGKLVFKKDNPSDLPQFDDELVIPIRFQ